MSQNKKDSRKYAKKSVLAANPDYLDGLALLANLELIDGNFEKAHQAIDKALKQDQKNDKLNIKGRILTTEKKWAEGDSSFARPLS